MPKSLLTVVLIAFVGVTVRALREHGYRGIPINGRALARKPRHAGS